MPRLIGANLDLLDVERVEILRGPQGTLAGRNSEGGVIKFISRKPSGETGGHLQVGYGSRDHIRVNGAVEFPLSEALATRLSGVFANQGGYVQGFDYGCLFPASGVPALGTANADCETQDFGDVNYYGLRGAFNFQPSDALEFDLIADFTEHDTNQIGNVLLFGDNSNVNAATENGLPLSSDFICGPYCNYADSGSAAGTFTSIIPPVNGSPVAASSVDNKSFYQSWGISLRGTFDLSDRVNLTSITAYREYESAWDQDTDASPARIDNTSVGLETEFFSQELRLNAELSDMIDITIGGYYSKEDTLQDTRVDIRYVAAGAPTLPLFPLQFFGGGPVEVENKSAFMTAFIRPTEALTITLGGRYTDENKSTTYRRLNYDLLTPNAFVDPIGAAYGIGYSGADTLDTDGDGDTTEIVTALNGLTSEFSGSRFDYRASIDYRFNDQLLVYATTSTGFKGGGISPRPFNSAQAVGFGEEELTSYEIGFKSDFFDDRVRLNTAFYLNKFKDAQLVLLSCPQFGGPGPCALPQNAGDATIKGVEVELNIEPVDGFNIDASLSLLDWEWDCVLVQVVRALAPGEMNTCSSDASIIGNLESPPQSIMTSQWSIGAQYDFNMGNKGTLSPRIDVSYQSEVAGGASRPAAGTPSAQFGNVPEFTLANARLTWRAPREDWQVSFAVTNLFDKYYFLTNFDLSGAGAGLITGSPARPREWMLSVRKNF